MSTCRLHIGTNRFDHVATADYDLDTDQWKLTWLPVPKNVPPKTWVRAVVKVSKQFVAAQLKAIDTAKPGRAERYKLAVALKVAELLPASKMVKRPARNLLFVLS